MAALIGLGDAKSASQTIYDPTCGSGSLLLKAHDQAPFDLTLYGQERDVATRALAKMNMVLHGCPSAEVWRDNTLTNPYFRAPDGKLKTFDFVVANPPFSDKAWGQGVDTLNDPFDRFVDGVPPAKNGDYAYLLHVLASLKSTGKAAVILPHGVLFRSNSEAEIRAKLIRKGVIKGIIGLPANLFFGTGIPACIIVLDKDKAATRKGIFMIDASKGFIKDGAKNRLREQDIHKIVDTFEDQRTTTKYARLVSLSEIERNGSDLSIPRYIDSSELEDLQDIEAHLKGGIPSRDVDDLRDYWHVMPSVRAALFGHSDRPGYLNPLVDAASVNATVLNHSEFKAFADKVQTAFVGWRAAHVDRLKNVKVGDKPRQIQTELAEDLLLRFDGLPLIDRYAVYQHFMTYWAEIMQDDVHLLIQEGWNTAKKLRDLTKNADGKYTEEPNFFISSGRKVKRLKAEIIPASLVISRFFSAEQKALDKIKMTAEEARRGIEDLDEAHAGEEGLLADARTETPF